MSVVRRFGRSAVLIVILVSCLVALSISNYLVRLHAPISAAGAGQDSIWADVCGGGTEGVAGCEEVVKSDYGVIHIPWPTAVVDTNDAENGKTGQQATLRLVSHPVPVALLGWGYYVFMFVWFLLSGLPRRASRGWHVLPMILSVAACVASVYYIYVMAVKIESWCRLCLGLHVLDFVICPAVIVLWPRPATTPDVRPGTEVPSPGAALSFRHAAAILIAAGAIIAGALLHRYDQTQTAYWAGQYQQIRQSLARVQNDARFLLNAYDGAPAVEIPERASQAFRGPADAPHVAVVFSDLMCPVCRRFEGQLHDHIIGLWDGRLKIVYRHFPLCTHCNPSQKSTAERPAGLHPEACDTAYAVEAAQLLGGTDAFWRMQSAIFKLLEERRGTAMDLTTLEKLAVGIGLDATRFREQIQGQEVRARVAEDVQLGIRLGLRETPVIFVDGVMLSGVQRVSMPFWKALTERARSSK